MHVRYLSTIFQPCGRYCGRVKTATIKKRESIYPCLCSNSRQYILLLSNPPRLSFFSPYIPSPSNSLPNPPNSKLQYTINPNNKAVTNILSLRYLSHSLITRIAEHKPMARQGVNYDVLYAVSPITLFKTYNQDHYRLLYVIIIPRWMGTDTTRQR